MLRAVRSTAAGLGLVMFVASLAGCGARTRLGDHAIPNDAAPTPDAFVEPVDAFRMDAGPPPNDAGSDANRTDAGFSCGASGAPLVGRICATTIFGREATLSCAPRFVDVIARGPGVLRWECGGTRAEASFPDGTLRGTRMGHSFTLCALTEFDLGDDCHWQSSQRIEGSLDTHLSMTYEDAPVVSDGSCTEACTVTASIGSP